MRYYTNQTADLIGESVEVYGWVDSIRDHGQLVFIDLRDKFGKLQVVVDPEKQKELFEVAKELKNEYVIKVTGKIQKRSEDLINPNIETGSIELIPEAVEMLNKSLPLPFPIDRRRS